MAGVGSSSKAIAAGSNSGMLTLVLEKAEPLLDSMVMFTAPFETSTPALRRAGLIHGDQDASSNPQPSIPTSKARKL
jgi:hypothetical protein